MLSDIFMACSKLEAMAIYVVNQACGNDIMPVVQKWGSASAKALQKLSPLQKATDQNCKITHCCGLKGVHISIAEGV